MAITDSDLFKEEPRLSAPEKPIILTTNNVGKIMISSRIILDWLQFNGGRILDVRMGGFFANETVEFLIEHPEMPLIAEFDTIPVVQPIYTRHYKRGKLVNITGERLSK